MTEEEWLACDAPTPMLEFLRGKVSNRKLRLFGVACCCEVRDLITTMEEAGIGCGFLAVRLGEQLADGRATREAVLGAIEDWVGMMDSGYSPYGHLLYNALPGLADADAHRGAIRTAEGAGIARGRLVMNRVDIARNERSRLSELSRAEGRAATEIAYAHQCDQLRDIFGNPFRPITLDPAWLTSTVVSLARQMYDSRDFATMPILADALQDAGCENVDVLQHCRGEGVHCRGCFVVDLVIGRG
jgi:hypothetical protein